MSEKSFQIALVKMLKGKSNNEKIDIADISLLLRDLTVIEKERLALLFEQQQQGISFFISLISAKREKKVRQLLYLSFQLIPGEVWVACWRSYCLDLPIECSIDPEQDALNFGNLLLSGGQLKPESPFEKEVIRYELCKIGFMKAVEKVQYRNPSSVPDISSVKLAEVHVTPYIIFKTRYNIAEFIMKAKTKSNHQIIYQNCSLIIFQNCRTLQTGTSEIAPSMVTFLEKNFPSQPPYARNRFILNLGGVDEMAKQKLMPLLLILNKNGLIEFYAQSNDI